jgi:hypothetical protein
MSYPEVSIIAAKRLPEPDANSLQEHVFSFCKCVDTPLHGRLGPDKFEMLALVGFNMELILKKGSNSMKEVAKVLKSDILCDLVGGNVRDVFELDGDISEDEDGDDDDDDDDGDNLIGLSGNKRPTTMLGTTKGTSTSG